MVKLVLLAVSMAYVLVAAACSDGDEGDAIDDVREITVAATEFAFEPAKINAFPGESVRVTLRNDGETQHSFTIRNPEAEADAASGDVAMIEFTTADTDASFFCIYHPEQMKGTINVGNPAPTETGSGTSGGGGGYGY